METPQTKSETLPTRQAKQVTERLRGVGWELSVTGAPRFVRHVVKTYVPQIQRLAVRVPESQKRIRLQPIS